MTTRAAPSTATPASASAAFAPGRVSIAVGERARLRRGRQRAAVDALDEALRRELAQVAPDRVLRHAELVGEPRRDDLAVVLERGEDRLPALGGEESVGCTFLHGHAWYCMVLRGSAREHESVAS